MRLRALLAAVVVPSLVVLAGCGSSPSSGGAESGGAHSGAAESEAAPSSPAALGPAIPADTAVADPVDRADMPEASGDFGDKPTITVPDNPPPDSLQRVVLSAGDGPVSAAGDWLTVDYLGQVWGGDVFDNSYDRGSPMMIQVGGPQRQVVVGWDVGLQGVAQGSRVMLSLPPRDGYGTDGNPPAISGTDTLVFVVDVIAVYGADTGGQTDATAQTPGPGLPTVSGDLGAAPTIDIPDSLPEPTDVSATVLATGSGDLSQAGNLLVQYTLSSWDGSHVESSWPDQAVDQQTETGPQLMPLAAGSPLDVLIGIPLGSRVLLVTPPDDSAGAPALAWVIDLLAQQSVAAAG